MAVFGGVVVLATAGAGFFLLRGGKAAAGTTLPTALARQGEFLVIVSCRGEIVAGRSMVVVAPVNVPNLQIKWLAEPNSAVKEGEPIIRFDEAGTRRQLQEKEAALKQAQAALEQAEADARIKLEQDRLDVASQKHAVERARLEAAKEEIVSAIQAEENRIALGLQRDKYEVQQATLELNTASGQSKIASLRAQRDKVQAEVELANRRLAQMELRSPLSGVVNYQMNYSQGWMNAKPFKVGDSVWAGSGIAEIPDLSTLQLKAKVDEIDRGRIQAGLDVRIVVDPFPEKPFAGKLASVSVLTERSFEEWPPLRNFRAFGDFKDPDPRLRPGMNGRLDIITDRLPNAISVPARAVFTRDGRPIVLVPGPQGLNPVRVEILARNPDEIAIRGIEAGTTVALVDSGTAEKKKP
jgi:HlyD family secretion protein